MEQETNLNKLEQILKLLDGSVTKEEFLKAFENVVNLVLKIEKRNTEAVDLLEKNYSALIEKIQNDHSSTLSDLKSQVNDVFVGDQLKRIREEHDLRMKLADEKISSVRNGNDSTVPGPEGKPGRPGKDGSPDTAGKIRDKLETLKDEDRLDVSAIRGIEKLVKDSAPTRAGGVAVKPITIQGLGVTIDKNVRFINFTGNGLTSVTRSKDGVVTVNIGGASSGTKVTEELPTNSGDNTNFTIAHTPTSGTFRLYRGGARQQSIGATPDFTLTGTALVLTIPLDVANGEQLFADYEY